MTPITETPRTYTIQVAAELTGLPASTLRYYEGIGMLAPVARDEGSGHRRFSEEDIDAAVAIACLNATGMSIEDMRVYMQHQASDPSSARRQRELLQRHKQHLEHEAEFLHLRQRYIDVKIAYWQAVEAKDEARVQELSELAHAMSKELRTPRETAA